MTLWGEDMAGAWEWSNVSVGDGRVLEVLTSGPRDGVPLLFHHGTPMAAAEFVPLRDLAAAQGLRTVLYSRPGYAQSMRHADRTVADVVSDVVAVLDALGAQTFFSLGWSMGGPHALACAALLPERCAAVATIASIAPHEAEGLDWMAGMMEMNVEEYSLALQGGTAVVPLLEKWRPDLAELQPANVAKALAARPDVDGQILAGVRDFVATSLRRSVSTGILGWLDDDLACLRPWGFDFAAITAPVSLWHGEKDVHAPYAHSVWLASRMPRARLRSLPEENHNSIVVLALQQIVGDLIGAT